jgi:membrane-associated phospholipid phosphatase
LPPVLEMTDNGAPGFRPIDIATLTYGLFEALLVIVFMSNQPGWFFLFTFYLAACGIVLVFALFQKYGITKSLRLFYPLFFIPLLYEALAKQIHLFHSGTFDSLINSFEMRVLGFDSSFAMQPYMTIWLNEAMSFFYMYYYILPFMALFFLVLRRRDDSTERAALGVCVAFYISYIIFILFPVYGPRFYLEDIYYLPLIGPFFTPLAHRIVSSGGLHGAAMPSSHCAVALVFTWYLAKEYRPAALPLIFCFVMLCIGTMYGRYHYISDVVVGLFIGGLSIVLTSRWQDRFLRAREKEQAASDLKPSEAIEIGV